MAWNILWILSIFSAREEADGSISVITVTAGTTTTTTTTTPVIPHNELSKLREIFLDTHNGYRASIARGQTEKNGHSGEIVPPASLMYAMRYNPVAETYAQRHVNSCNRVISNPLTRPGFEENINILDRTNTDEEGAAQWMAWWNNTELGCAVKNCGTFYFTSCMYGPGGNEVGRRIYNIGAVCSGCPHGCAYGLCPTP
ncbi:unnamed protein product [Strongylus vulgaris]|uniref:SCP domain-containing protein n=1 Tax=Strongylus vulgaris TaxID=40348 RepID=A0A3P7JGL8_STRVU|nr:unnamed protein product [Strongylus vulgaris]